MTKFMWAFLLLGLTANAAAQSNVYTLDSAPWSNQKYEVCRVANDNGLRAVIFEAEIEEWTYPEADLLTTRLVASADGIKEVTVKKERHSPAYYLKEQKIAYLDNMDNWVDKSGMAVRSLDQLESLSGEKVKPVIKINYEKFVYKANLELEHASAIEKIHYEAPCTAFSVGHYDKLETETYYDFGQNNPYQCDAKKSLKRSQKLNYTKTSHRPIVTIPDGSSYYVKYPNGKISTYPWYGFEYLYKEDGSLICDWNDLGSLIGYELTNAIQ